MKAKSLGLFDFGCNRLELLTRGGCGGEFYLRSSQYRHATIFIGIEYEKSAWDEVLNVLIHEVFEALCAMNGFRFEKSPSYTWANDRFSFCFDHKDFSELVSRAAMGLAKALPLVEKAFREQFKGKKS